VSFRDALLAIHQLRTDGVINEYAIGGAMAIAFWAEPVSTFDVDVFALLPPTSGPMVSLEPLYTWAAKHGHTIQQEHIILGGIPVQIIPAHNSLAEEAVHDAATLDMEAIDVRVIRPEYLIALYLEPSARTRKRLERVAALLEESDVDRTRLDTLLKKYGLTLPGR
jgi:hypothetical protein